MSCMMTKQTTFEDVTDGQHMVKRLKVDSDPCDYQEEGNMTILDVIDDCLVKIFMNLDLNDLLNVAASNSRFKIPTESAFVRKHLDIPVTVSNIDADFVDGRMLQFSINILQKFGHCITSLCIKFKLENVERLIEAVVAYSGNYVVKLKFLHEKETWYMGLHRTGVRRIKRQLRELKTKFPNLLHLKFNYHDSVDCPYSDDIIQAIPSLMYFSVTGLIFSHEDVDRFIALNRQLEQLHIWVLNGFVSQSFINNLGVSLPKLKSLIMNRVTMEGTLEPAHHHGFSNLTKLTYGKFSASFPVNGLSSLFGEGIEDLELYCDDHVITNLAETISRFKKLKKLSLYLPPYVPKPTLLTFSISIVAPMAIREFILRNNELTEIEIDWFYKLEHLRPFNDELIAFKNEIEQNQWYVRVIQWLLHNDYDHSKLMRMRQTFFKKRRN